MRILETLKTIGFALAVMVLLLPAARAQDLDSIPQNTTSAGDVTKGAKTYVVDGCYECHGRVGQGSTWSGPKIGPNPMPYASFLRYVRQPRGQMPPYTGKVMSDAEVADVYAFLAKLPSPPLWQNIPLLKDGPKSQKKIARQTR